MCGRFTLTRSAAEVAAHFGVAETAPLPGWRARYNVAPGQDIAVVRDADGARRLEWRRWGLVPSWARDPKIGSRLINARLETAAEKPSFRSALRRRRCLVPADGFYEWKALAGRKQPHHVTLPEGALFGIAGLYEHWKGEGGEPIDSVTLLTCDANERIRPLHARMPVLVDPARYATWLDPAASVADALAALAGDGPAAALTPQPVSTRVNRVQNDDPDCIAPVRPLRAEDF